MKLFGIDLVIAWYHCCINSSPTAQQYMYIYVYVFIYLYMQIKDKLIDIHTSISKFTSAYISAYGILCLY